MQLASGIDARDVSDLEMMDLMLAYDRGLQPFSPKWSRSVKAEA